MKTLEKMTSHSAKIPIKSLAEYCFFTSSWHCKAPKTFKIYLQDVLLLLPFSSTMLCFFTQGERWQSSTAGKTLTRDKYLTQPHIRRPRLSLQGINTKKICVSANISMSESPLGPKIEYWEVLFTPENEVLWDIFVEKWNAIIKVGF